MNGLLNKYHKQILLYLFVITLAGGSFILEFKLFGVDLYAFRLVLMLSLPYLLFTGKLRLYRNKVSKYTFFFLITWLLYACVSLLWCLDKTMAFKDIMYLLWGIAIFIFLVSISENYSKFNEEMMAIWTQVFIVVLIIAAWEILTANHIVSNFTQRLHELKAFNRLNFVPVATFDNPNHYAVYTSLSSVLFVDSILKKQNVIISSFLIACCLFLTEIQSARFGYITFGIYGLLLLFYYYKSHPHTELRAMRIMAFRFFILFAVLVAGIFCSNRIENVYDEKAKEAIVAPDDHLPSNVLRKNLIHNGIDYFVASAGKGVGAGNYMTYTRLGKGKYDTSGIDSPHCWFIEIVSQYGLPILLLFALCFLYYLKAVYNSVKQVGFLQKHLIILMLIACYFIMSNSNSIFMPLPVNWFMLSLIVILTDGLSDNPAENV